MKETSKNKLVMSSRAGHEDIMGEINCQREQVSRK